MRDAIWRFYIYSLLLVLRSEIVLCGCVNVKFCSSGGASLPYSGIIGQVRLRFKKHYDYAAIVSGFGPQCQKHHRNQKRTKSNPSIPIHTELCQKKQHTPRWWIDWSIMRGYIQEIKLKADLWGCCQALWFCHGKTDLHRNLDSQPPAVDFTLRRANKNSGPWLPAEEGK